jgi:hypothetical protein
MKYMQEVEVDLFTILGGAWIIDLVEPSEKK